MALTLESAGLVRQKVFHSTMNPAIYYAVRAFFRDWAQNHGNADLQWVPYAGADAEAANGDNFGLAAACTVRAFYGKKPRIAEDVFMAILDDASGAEGTDFRASIGFFAIDGTDAAKPQDEAFAFWPTGLPITNGVNIKAYTTVSGTTDSTAGAAPDGWYIISA